MLSEQAVAQGLSTKISNVCQDNRFKDTNQKDTRSLLEGKFIRNFFSIKNREYLFHTILLCKNRFPLFDQKYQNKIRDALKDINL